MALYRVIFSLGWCVIRTPDSAAALWVQVLDLLLAYYVSQEKLLSCSVPQFAHL